MPLNINFQQILLHFLNFAVLFAILYFLLYKPVKNFMDSREEYYKSIDDNATAKLKDAEALKAEYAKKLELYEDEISVLKQKAHDELEQSSAVKIKMAEQEAQKIISDAREDIENQRAKMLKDAKSEITEMVTSAAEKLVTTSKTSEAFDAFLDVAKRGEADE